MITQTQKYAKSRNLELDFDLLELFRETGYISNLTTEEGADCVHAFLGWQDYFELTISDIDDKEDDDVLTENEVKLRKTLSELLVAMQENEIEFILFDKY